LGTNRIYRCFEIKEIRFWGQIGFLAALRLKKSDFGDKSDLSLHEIKEIRFWGQIGFIAALRLKKSDFGDKSDLSLL